METELSSEYFRHETCGLETPNHQINSDFVAVLEAVSDEAPIGVEVAASGCGSCYSSDTPAALFWIAQNDATDDVSVNFDSEDESFDKKELGWAVVSKAEEMGVEVSWNGDGSKTIVLGESDAYTNLDPGTRVRRSRLYGEDRTGTVVDADAYNDSLDWYVAEDLTPDKLITKEGDVLAKFPSREKADAYAEMVGTPTTVRSMMHAAVRDGVNLVQFDGAEYPCECKTEDLIVD